MKKIVISLHIILILLSVFLLYNLWMRLTQVPSEMIQLNKYEIHGPCAKQIKLLKNYPPLFYVLAPTAETEKKVDQTGTLLKEIVTKNGKMRVRGIFSLGGNRLALVEIIDAGSSTFTEVREKDILQGYRVLAIESKRIRLQGEDSDESMDLIIFDRDKKNDRH